MRSSFTSIASTLALFFFVSGCGGGANLKERGIDDSIAPITGTRMSPEWKEYNEKAQKKNLPQLVFFSTSLKLKGKSPASLTDHFTLSDTEAIIYSKWTHISSNSKYKLNLIDPRGRLFESFPLSAQKPTDTYWFWFRLNIKNSPASELPGKWQARIFMDDKFVCDKNIFIGYEQAKYTGKALKDNAPSIMVTPFLNDRKGKYYGGFTYSIPALIAQKLSIEYPDYKVLTPYMLKGELAEPPAYEKPDAAIKKSLNSELIHSLIKKYNARLSITGYYYYTGYTDQNVDCYIFIVDTKSFQIKRRIKVSSIPGRERKWQSFKIYFYNKIYQKIMTENGIELNNILKH